MAYVKNTVEITDDEHDELKAERREHLNESNELGEMITNQGNFYVYMLMKLYDLNDYKGIGEFMAAAIKDDIEKYGVE